MSGSDDVRVWNPAASGAAIEAEAEGHTDYVSALVTFVDPATGETRLASGSWDKTIRVWDVETGGGLLVINVGESVRAMSFFVDPGTGAPRLACGTGNRRDSDVRVFDPVAGGEALLVIDVGSHVFALAFFVDPATGAPRLACTLGKKVLVFDPVAGKIRRDRGEGKYDIAYDDGDEETAVDARLIRKPQLSPLAIAKERGHSSIVALLEEHQK